MLYFNKAMINKFAFLNGHRAIFLFKWDKLNSEVLCQSCSVLSELYRFTLAGDAGF